MAATDIFAAPPEKLSGVSGIHVRIVADDDALSRRFADEMIGRINQNNRIGLPTALILPVGPRGGYPVFVEDVREKTIDLSRTTFFFMDEYVTEDGLLIPEDHPLSFRGFVRENLILPLAGRCGFDPAGVRFPDPGDPDRYGRMIKDAGGIDLALCGVGIDGHVAFNEPEHEMSVEEFAGLSTRIVVLTPETRTVNAVMEAGGAIDLIPASAVTVGMAEIMAARRIVVFMNRAWHRAAVRMFLFGEVTATFPVSLIRRHENFEVVITSEVASLPLEPASWTARPRKGVAKTTGR